MKYWVLKMGGGKDGVYLSCLPKSDSVNGFEYGKGRCLIDRHPKGIHSAMYYDPDYPEKIKLNDFVPNLDTGLIGNSRVREVLDGLQIDNVEYLPVWLMDHQDKLSSKDYTILNPIGGVDIIDMEKSELVMGSIIKNQVKVINHLVLDYNAIPDDAKLFRASKKLGEYFIRDDVKAAFEQADLTGFQVIPAEGWNGL